jgi:hypothetical protein
MTCRLNYLFSYFFLSEHALQSEVPSGLFALRNLLGPPNLNRFIRLFSSTGLAYEIHRVSNNYIFGSMRPTMMVHT